MQRQPPAHKHWGAADGWKPKQGVNCVSAQTAHYPALKLSHESTIMAAAYAIVCQEGGLCMQNSWVKKFVPRSGAANVALFGEAFCPMLVPCEDLFHTFWARREKVVEGFNSRLPSRLRSHVALIGAVSAQLPGSENKRLTTASRSCSAHQNCGPC